MFWPGNCVTLTSSIIKVDCKNGKTGVNQGMAALRFVTVEAAELFKKLFNGLEIWYQQYSNEPFVGNSVQDLKLNKYKPELIW